MATQDAFTELGATKASERERAFRQLYEEHCAMVYRLACRCGIPASEVEDVVQRVFFVAHQHLRDGDRIDNMGGWLRGVVFRIVSQHRRWRKVRKVKHWLLQSTVDVQTRRPESPESGIATAQVRDRVGEVLMEMSPKLRDVLVLTDLEECTPREAAETLGVPLNTVRSRRRLAREQFRARWERLEEADRG